MEKKRKKVFKHKKKVHIKPTIINNKINPILVKFISKALEKNYSEKYIKNGLKLRKWPNDEIELAFKQAKQNQKIEKPKEIIKPKPIEKPILKEKPKHHFRLFKKHSKQTIAKPKEIIKPKPVIKPKKLIKKEIKPRKKIKFNPKFFTLILVAILGYFASYFSREMYIYIISVFLILLNVIILLKKPKIKIIQSEPKKEPEQIIPKKIYTTEFDRFYDYILQKKNVSISQLSKTFKIPKKQVEEWAEILEVRGLVRIDYPVIGEPKVKYKT